jgi:hypothetical protein
MGSDKLEKRVFRKNEIGCLARTLKLEENSVFLISGLSIRSQYQVSGLNKANAGKYEDNPILPTAIFGFIYLHFFICVLTE